MNPKYSVPYFQRMGDIRNCCCHTAVKLHEHGIKVVEIVLKKCLCGIVTVRKTHLLLIKVI